MEEKHQLGKKGEELAEKFFIDLGYQILEKNWRFQKAEVDLIAQNNNCVVFVEVKTRSSKEFGNPESFVSNKQQQLILHAANEYIMQNEIDIEARFDILSIIKKDNEYLLEHIEDAFYPTL